MNFSPEVRPIPERTFDDIVKYFQILTLNPEMIYSGRPNFNEVSGIELNHVFYSLNELAIYLYLPDYRLRVSFEDSINKVYTVTQKQALKLCELQEDISKAIHKAFEHNLESLITGYYEDSKKADLFEDTIEDVKEVK